MDKMATMEDILAKCLDNLEQGDSVENCLARYPGWREELEPLLWAAQRARQVPEVRPSPSFRQDARARLLDKIDARTSAKEEAEEKEKRRLLSGLKSKLRFPVIIRGLAAPALAAITVLVLLGVMGIGVVHASSESLPGDPLYGVKLAGERVRLALSLNEMQDTQLRLRWADRRLREARRSAELERTEGVKTAMNGYVREIEAVSGTLRARRAAGEDVWALSRRLQREMAQHQEALRLVQKRVGEEAWPAVERAKTASEAAEKQASEPPEPPQPSPTARQPIDTATATVTPKETKRPTRTATPSPTSKPTRRGRPTEPSEPAAQTRTPEPPGQTHTSQPPGQTRTPEPPGQTHTPEPPGQTHTPQPPGQTRTPGPRDQNHTPEPPGQTRTPQPPGQTRTPGPPG